MHDADAGVLERLPPRLRAMAIASGVPPADVDDVVHDTLLAALEKLAADRFRHESALATWVHGILKHKISEYWRTKRRMAQRLVEIDGEAGLTADGAAGTLAVPPDLDMQLWVASILAALPPRERLVLLLNKQDGHPTRQIAPLLHVGQKVAEKLLTAAKKHFVELVQEGEENSATMRLTKKGGHDRTG